MLDDFCPHCGHSWSFDVHARCFDC
jgi:hypothetical protein